MLPNVKMLLLIALTKQKLNAKWTTSRNVSIVSSEKMPSNELLLLRRYSISRILLVILEFSNVSCNRKGKMQNWRKGEKKKRLLDHTILCLMWRKTKVCQERRAESWKRISCRYQVRGICIVISVSHGVWNFQSKTTDKHVRFWARYSCKWEIPIRKISLLGFDCTREIRIGYPMLSLKSCKPVAAIHVKV